MRAVEAVSMRARRGDMSWRLETTSSNIVSRARMLELFASSGGGGVWPRRAAMTSIAPGHLRARGGYGCAMDRSEVGRILAGLHRCIYVSVQWDNVMPRLGIFLAFLIRVSVNRCDVCFVRILEFGLMSLL